MIAALGAVDLPRARIGTTLFLGGCGAAVVASLVVPFFWMLPRSWVDGLLPDALGLTGMALISASGLALALRYRVRVATAR